jgi:hypothetical protein
MDQKKALDFTQMMLLFNLDTNNALFVQPLSALINTYTNIIITIVYSIRQPGDRPEGSRSESLCSSIYIHSHVTAIYISAARLSHSTTAGDNGLVNNDV